MAESLSEIVKLDTCKMSRRVNEWSVDDSQLKESSRSRLSSKKLCEIHREIEKALNILRVKLCDL